MTFRRLIQLQLTTDYAKSLSNVFLKSQLVFHFASFVSFVETTIPFSLFREGNDSRFVCFVLPTSLNEVEFIYISLHRRRLYGIES